MFEWTNPLNALYIAFYVELKFKMHIYKNEETVYAHTTYM